MLKLSTWQPGKKAGAAPGGTRGPGLKGTFQHEGPASSYWRTATSARSQRPGRSAERPGLPCRYHHWGFQAPRFPQPDLPGRSTPVDSIRLQPSSAVLSPAAGNEALSVSPRSPSASHPRPPTHCCWLAVSGSRPGVSSSAQRYCL